ncbi:YraN family protein [Candidatus Falkowbacteria bacterium]|nr:YraN family protein [Candidatus Falkowbacteria bacterium]
MPGKKSLGDYGERLASKYLAKKGYKIITTNYRTRYGEVDLICAKAGQIIFIEVKTRTNLAFGQPEESIDQRKLEKLNACAEIYMYNKNNDWQIDAVSIIIAGKKISIKHLQNIN